MKAAVVNRGFLRSDIKQQVKPGQTIIGEDAYINELSRGGLVRETRMMPDPEELKAPFADAGERSCASPAAQASQIKTAHPSKRGRPRKQPEA
jgi:hypothetical protein